ncbi:unnamed protein product [Cochlearia groenlandica]
MAETISTGETQYRPFHGGSTTDRKSTVVSLLRKLKSHSPTSTELFDYFGLFISIGIFAFLLGITFTAVIIGSIVFFPLIIVSSPIWIPIFAIFAGLLTISCSVLGTVAVVWWTYRYYRGMHPVGSVHMDYARSRVYDTASHVKDYAREYGGYFHGRAKDAAPGA